MFINFNSTPIPLVLLVLGLHSGTCSKTYFQHKDTCTVSLLSSWASSPILNRKAYLQLACARECVRDPSCNVPVLQIFQDGSSGCNRFSDMGQLDDFVSVPTPGSCYMVAIGCKNGGQLMDGVCVCGNLFAGELCEKPNPTYCTREWGLAANVKIVNNTGSVEVVDTDRYTYINKKQPKAQYTENGLTVTYVAPRILTHTPPYRVHSHTLMEKSEWNRYTSSPARQFMHNRGDGWQEVISYNSTSGQFDSATVINGFRFFSAAEDIFAQDISVDDANQWTDMKEALEEGAQVWVSNTAAVFTDSIVTQSVDIAVGFRVSLVPIVLIQPQRWLQYRQEYSSISKNDTNRDKVGMQLAYGMYKYYDKSVANYSLNPCWSKLTDGVVSAPTERLGRYMMRGHTVRARADNIWFDVLSVIQVGEEFSFMLAPFFDGGWAARLTENSTTGVKTLLSTAGHAHSCTYEMEQEQVGGHTWTSGVDYSIYLDTRNWEKLYAVRSDSTVLYGTESRLVFGILKGRDVRVVIQWQNQNRTWYLDAYTNTVTPSGKVSSETVTTWAVEDRYAATMTLNSQCDYETLMVTSEGHTEIVKFNSQSNGHVTQLNDDIIIFWFLQ